MPMIDNPRHELFAQELAAGKTQAEAYLSAGYKPSEPNASRLTRNDKVQARVAELQGRAAAKAVLTREWIIERLIENANRAMKAGGPEGSIANRALELLGKELGMFIERSENTNTNVNYAVSDQPPTDDEWEAEHGTAH